MGIGLIILQGMMASLPTILDAAIKDPAKRQIANAASNQVQAGIRLANLAAQGQITVEQLNIEMQNVHENAPQDMQNLTAAYMAQQKEA